MLSGAKVLFSFSGFMQQHFTVLSLIYYELSFLAPNKHLRTGSDKCGGLCANVYHFSWMVDYIQEDYDLKTIQHNFTSEQSSPSPLLGPLCAEGGGAKSVAEALLEGGHTIAAAYDISSNIILRPQTIIMSLCIRLTSVNFFYSQEELS